MQLKTIGYIPVSKTAFSYHFPLTSKNEATLLMDTGRKNFDSCRKIKIGVMRDDGTLYFSGVAEQPEGKEYLNIPGEVKRWIEDTFIFSTIMIREGVLKGSTYFKKKTIQQLVDYLAGGKKSFDPLSMKCAVELIRVSVDEANKTLYLDAYHRITPGNIDQFVNETAKSLLFRYLFKNFDTLKMSQSEEGVTKLNKHISFFAENGATRWMSAQEYKDKSVNEPGIYNLRKTLTDAGAANHVRRSYYTGKAKNIGNRVVATADSSKPGCYTVGHKNDIQFDEVRYDVISFRELLDMIEVYSEALSNAATEAERKKITSSFEDSVLYGIEGVMNHTVRMILEEEGAEFCNSSFDKASSHAAKQK